MITRHAAFTRRFAPPPILYPRSVVLGSITCRERIDKMRRKVLALLAGVVEAMLLHLGLERAARSISTQMQRHTRLIVKVPAGAAALQRTSSMLFFHMPHTATREMLI